MQIIFKRFSIIFLRIKLFQSVLWNFKTSYILAEDTLKDFKQSAINLKTKQCKKKKIFVGIFQLITIYQTFHNPTVCVMLS